MSFWDTNVTHLESKSIDVYRTAVENKIQQLSKELDKLKLLRTFKVKWSKTQPITSRMNGLSNVIGVYRIIYKPTNKTMSIGQGRVGGRKARHVAVFKNDGRDVIHENGSTSPSITGQKMYKYDSNIDNWLFSWCDVKSKAIAPEYERLLQEMENPHFNNLSMGGNN